MLALNLGCGSERGHKFLNLKGMVNVDVAITELNKKILDVRCDAHFLPFRDKVFSVVLMEHVLEHVDYPLNVLREMHRVSNKAIIRVPNVRCHGGFGEADVHLYSWGNSTLYNLCKRVYGKVDIYGSWFDSPRFLPFLKKTFVRLRSFFNTNELTAVCENVERE